MEENNFVIVYEKEKLIYTTPKNCNAHEDSSAVLYTTRLHFKRFLYQEQTKLFGFTVQTENI